MGVPKFFRYISERYPCINETLKEYQIPEFDNLYLDMNGIIHVCSHDDSLTYCTSEEQIFKDIFYYVELMFRLIQPQKVFMMAVDGVAPRAKMNQQRGRRFRTAKDAEEAEKKIVQSGKELPQGSRFDSNCITPGTEFMARLHEQLKFFIAHKVSTDKLWQKPKIVYSGHNVPGEGEHKIMDYIRYLRSRDDWDPNTRHCVHGLDADLIMLGLCSHEPHFSLLREEVKFTKKQKRPKNPEEIQFFLLHLSLLRDYLDCEFQELKQKLRFPYDLEKIIDDWVLIGFLVGNDFIPQLPNLHIGNNALHSLYQSYIEILPTLGGYINEAGTLNLERFEKYLDALSKYDLVNYKEVSMDLKYFESKTGKIDGGENPEDNWEMGDGNAELLKMIKETQDLLGDDNDYDDDDEDAAIAAEFVEYKVDYYKKKLEYENVTKEVLMDQAEGYIRAIIWNLQYYYNGCQSWSWYFPHHYSPYLSDLRGFKDWNFEFPNDKPFLPFQQLLAVLPAASRNILPKAFRDLMTSPTSPIIDYYPNDFETDLNGKKQEWEAVVLIPFIKEDVLLEAMEPCLSKLTDEERLRNTHGPVYIYEYTSDDTGRYKAPEFFPDIEHNHSIYKEVWSDEILIPKNKVVKGLHPRAGEAQSYGFPTLKHVPFTAVLREGRVRVFEQPSRGSNVILYVKDRHNRNTALEDLDKPKENSSRKSAPDGRQASEDVDPMFLKDVAYQLLGKEIYVSWPHLMKARVAGVASTQDKYIESKGRKVHEKMSKHEAYKWGLDACEIRMLHHGRMGIELGSIEILVYAHIVEGVKYMFDDKGNGTLSYLWSRRAKAFPYQTIVTQINMVNTPLDGPLSARIEKIFYPGAQVFMLDVQHYGSMATVTSIKGGGRVVVELPDSYNEPDFSEIDFQNSNSVVYYPGHQAAQRLGLSPHFLSCITGTIYIQSAHTASDKTNIGLNLKFNKSNQEVVGYTKKTGEKQWLYSNKCVSLVNDYLTKFPKLFEKLSIGSTGNCVFFKDDIFPEGDGDEQVKLISAWLKEQDHRSAELRACGSSLLSEDSIKEMEQVVIRTRNKAEKPASAVTLQVKPHHIHIPKAQLNLLVPDPLANHNILDRVVSVRESHTIPLGYRGTIIGIEKKEDELATLYDILFDDEIICGIQLFTETKRCYRLTKQAFINISYGKSLQTEMSPHESQAAVQNWKTNDGHLNNDLQPRQDNLHAVKGVNSGSVMNNFNNKTPNTVSQFFSAYRQPSAKNIFLVGQQAKEDSVTGLGISLKPQQPQPSPSQPPKNVDAEFQAMWSQLQQKLPTSPPTSVNPQLPSTSVITPQAVSEQTNALKKFLRINESERPQQPPASAPMQQPQCQPVAPCEHAAGTCCAELASMCLRLNVPYPHCSQRLDHHSGKVSGVLLFADGTEFVGPKSNDRSKASERVACLAVKQYPGVLAKKSASGASKPPGMMGGPLGVPIPAALAPFPPQGVLPMGGPMVRTRGHGMVVSEQLVTAPQAPRLAPQVPVLPSPPQQWCQQEPKPAVGFPPASSQPPQPVASRFGANPFVPLQAQTAAIVRNSEAKPSQAQPPAGITDERLNNDVIRPVPQSPKKPTPPPPTSRQQRTRRGRIAAKFSTPLQK